MTELINRLVVVSPGGNTTAIILDDIASANRQELNSAVMSAWAREFPGQPKIEQCCVIVEPQNLSSIGRIEMFGGEFCGNATRSVISQLVGKDTTEGLIESSGMAEPLKFRADNGTVELDIPIAAVAKVANGLLVQFEGISQLVAESKDVE